MKNSDVRNVLEELLQSAPFVLKVINQGKSAEKQLTVEDWKKVGACLPPLYAVVATLEISVALNLCGGKLYTVLQDIVAGTNNFVADIANRCARLAWQAQQPLLGEGTSSRLERTIMGYNSGSLPEHELEKDSVSVQKWALAILKELET